MKDFTVMASGCTHWIDESKIDTCKEEGVSAEQVFFALLCCLLYCHELSEHRFCVVVKKHSVTQDRPDLSRIFEGEVTIY